MSANNTAFQNHHTENQPSILLANNIMMTVINHQTNQSVNTFRGSAKKRRMDQTVALSNDITIATHIAHHIPATSTPGMIKEATRITNQ